MVLVGTAVFVLAGVFGATAVGLLNARNPFSDPSSASARAEALIERATGREASPGMLALVPAPPGSPATSAALTIARVPGVAAVTAPGPGHEAGLVSTGGRSSLVVATLQAGPDPSTVVAHLQQALRSRDDVLLGGGDVAGVQTGKRPRPTSASPRPSRSRCSRSWPCSSSAGSPPSFPSRSEKRRCWSRSWSCGWSTWRFHCRSSR